MTPNELHAAIMNLPLPGPNCLSAYECGYHDARRSAAELVLSAMPVAPAGDAPRWFIGKPSQSGRYFMAHRPEDWDINKCVGVQRVEYGTGEVIFQACIDSLWVNVEQLAGCIWYGPLLAPRLTSGELKRLRSAAAPPTAAPVEQESGACNAMDGI